jgi:Ran GTPase-activating protein (RanGAP) involved in mRNA processing and transport
VVGGGGNIWVIRGLKEYEVVGWGLFPSTYLLTDAEKALSDDEDGGPVVTDQGDGLDRIVSYGTLAGSDTRQAAPQAHTASHHDLPSAVGSRASPVAVPTAGDVPPDVLDLALEIEGVIEEEISHQRQINISHAPARPPGARPSFELHAMFTDRLYGRLPASLMRGGSGRPEAISSALVDADVCFLRATTGFVAKDDEELVLIAGDIVVRLRCDSGSGWWYGVAATRRGLFPAAAVRVTDVGPTFSVGIVTSSFSGDESSHVLGLNEDQVVIILTPLADPETGAPRQWHYGALVRNVGMFLGLCTQTLANPLLEEIRERLRTKRRLAEEERRAALGLPAADDAAPAEFAPDTTNPEELEPAGPRGVFPSTFVRVVAETQPASVCVATYDFDNDDNVEGAVTFKKDDRLLVDEMVDNPGWWVGCVAKVREGGISASAAERLRLQQSLQEQQSQQSQLDDLAQIHLMEPVGKQGLFPSTFVEVVKIVDSCAYCRAVTDFTDPDGVEDALTFKEGDKLVAFDFSESPGWWSGFLLVKRKDMVRVRDELAAKQAEHRKAQEERQAKGQLNHALEMVPVGETGTFPSTFVSIERIDDVTGWAYAVATATFENEEGVANAVTFVESEQLIVYDYAEDPGWWTGQMLAVRGSTDDMALGPGGSPVALVPTVAELDAIRRGAPPPEKPASHAGAQRAAAHGIARLPRWATATHRSVSLMTGSLVLNFERGDRVLITDVVSDGTGYGLVVSKDLVTYEPMHFKIIRKTSFGTVGLVLETKELVLQVEDDPGSGSGNNDGEGDDQAPGATTAQADGGEDAENSNSMQRQNTQLSSSSSLTTINGYLIQGEGVFRLNYVKFDPVQEPKVALNFEQDPASPKKQQASAAASLWAETSAGPSLSASKKAAGADSAAKAKDRQAIEAEMVDTPTDEEEGAADDTELDLDGELSVMRVVDPQVADVLEGLMETAVGDLVVVTYSRELLYGVKIGLTGSVPRRFIEEDFQGAIAGVTTGTVLKNFRSRLPDRVPVLLAGEKVVLLKYRRGLWYVGTLVAEGAMRPDSVFPARHRPWTQWRSEAITKAKRAEFQAVLDRQYSERAEEAQRQQEKMGKGGRGGRSGTQEEDQDQDQEDQDQEDQDRDQGQNGQKSAKGLSSVREGVALVQELVDGTLATHNLTVRLFVSAVAEPLSTPGRPSLSSGYYTESRPPLALRATGQCLTGKTLVQSIPAISHVLPRLHTLDLCDNPLGPGGGEVVREIILAHASSLTVLLLARCDLRDLGVSEIFTFIPEGLRVIDLCGNDVGDAGAFEIASSVMGMDPEELTINLEDSLITSRGAQLIARAVALWPNVRFLLSGNRIMAGGFVEICRALAADHNCEVVAYNRMHIHDDGAVALAELIRVNTSVRRVVATHNCIGDLGAASIASNLLVTQVGVTELDLHGNHIRIPGVRSIAAMLRLNNTLTSLNLSHNCFDFPGVSALAESLSSNQTLRHLFLCNSSIADQGAIKISEHIPACRSLTELDLSHNCIGSSGASALADAISNRAKPTNLRSLNLSHNFISEQGAVSLSLALVNKQVIVPLEGNPIGPHGTDLSVGNFALCSRTDAPTVFSFAACKAGDAGCSAVARALAAVTKVVDQPAMPPSTIQGSLGQKTAAPGNQVNRSLQRGSTADSINKPGGLLSISSGSSARNLLAKQGTQQQQQGGAGAPLAVMVEQLFLDGNGIGSAGLDSLSRVLASKDCVVAGTLRVLSLERNELADRGAAQLIGVLGKSCPALTSLNLARCKLGVQSIGALAAMLAVPLCPLEHLNLSANPVTQAPMTELALALGTNQRLREIDLSHCALGPAVSEALGVALRTNASLLTLDCSNNSFTDEGVAPLTAYLKENTTLTCLRLDGNGLGDPGAMHLSRSLFAAQRRTRGQGWLALRTLSLSWNRLRDEGVQAICRELPNSCPSLTELNLDNNRFGEEGAVAVGILVRNVMPPLRIVRAHGNPVMSSGGAQALADVLLTVGFRGDVDFSGVNCTDSAASSLSALGASGHVRQLSIADNPIGGNGLALLASAFRKRTYAMLRSLDLSRTLGTAQSMASLCSALALVQAANGQPLEVLRLAGNRLDPEALAGLLGVCHGLRVIDLGDCGLGSAGAAVVAPPFKALVYLETALLQRNNLGDQGVKHFVDALLEAMGTLTELDLSANSLGASHSGQLGSLITQLRRLLVLRVRDNELGGRGVSDLATAVATHKRLKDLDLDGNSAGIEGGRALAKALQENSSVTSLRCSSNGLGLGGTAAFGPALSGNVSLTSLSISDNQARADGTRLLVQGLLNNVTLTHLDLARNDVRDSGCEAFCESLSRNSTLRSVRLQDNDIGPAGARAIAALLSSLTCNLDVIDMARNRIDPRSAMDIGNALRQRVRPLQVDLTGNLVPGLALERVLESAHPSSTFALAGNPLGMAGGVALGKFLNIMSCQTTLCLAGCSLGDKGIEHLSPGLSSNYIVTELDISNNLLSEKAALALGASIPSNVALRILNVSDNNLGPAGIAALCQGLIRRESMLRLNVDVSRTGLGDDGALALVPLLDSGRLRSLTARGNDIGPRGAACFSETLQKNTQLDSLDVGDNPRLGDAGLVSVLTTVLALPVLQTLVLDSVGASGVGVERLARALEVLQTITHLDISGNALGPEALEALVAALSARTSASRLKVLAMNDCALGDPGLAVLCKSWTRHTPHLIGRASSSKRLTGLMRAPEHLSLKANGIRNCAPLGFVVLHNNSVIKLDLSSNAIEDEGLVTFSQTLREAELILSELVLRDNRVSDAGASALSELILASVPLARVDLSGNRIGPVGGRMLGEVVRTTRVRKVVTLSRNPLQAAGAAALVRSLVESDLPTPPLLDLSAMGLTEDNLVPETNSLTSGLRQLDALQGLDFSSNRLGGRFVALLSGCLMSQGSNLVTLNLAGNKLDVKACIALAEALESNRSVVNLNLNANLIGPEGAAALAHVARTHSSLARIDVQWCGIGDDGAVALAQAMEAHRGLDVAFSGNKIGARGAAAIAAALPVTTAVTSLRLGWNNITTAGVDKICASLATNNTVASLHFPENSLRDTAMRPIIELLQSNPIIVSMNIARNLFTNQGFTELGSYLALRQAVFKVNISGNRISEDCIQFYRAQGVDVTW